MKDGFIRVAAVSPRVRVADCVFNAKKIIEAISQAVSLNVKLLVTPELSLTGCTCGDLFSQPVLLKGAESALGEVMKATIGSDIIVAAGLPVPYSGKLYSCAAIVQNGRLLGVVPKGCLPVRGDCFGSRNFSPAFSGMREVSLCGQTAPFGQKLLFACLELPELVIAAEIGEDMSSPCPPCAGHALAGASVVINPAAESDLVGRPDYRRGVISSMSARLVCGYIRSNAGRGESTTDAVFSGQRIIAENGVILKEAAPFSDEEIAFTEIDISRLAFERRRGSSFPDCGTDGYTVIPFSLTVEETALSRSYPPFPFVPAAESDRERRCEEILLLQAHGLAKRIEHSRAKSLVIGLSGGLDSTLAILVCARALKLLGRSPSDICAITMPCFGTTARTRGNAEILAERVGARLRTIDIARSVQLHFEDIGHAADNFNVVYENAQARERTQILMDAANQENGLVIGTGDLSELALGWATYNGDHMSMYGVNASVPKTLIRHLVRYEADSTSDEKLREVLLDVLDTPVSPELLPAKDGEISQKTEDLVGPYELHDFFLYYAVRCAFSPAKILRLAETAFSGSYDRDTLLKWLKNFYRRFFSQQFKRSCLPDGPGVGSLSLSPRGGWLMPSDGCADLWLSEAESL